MTLKSFDVFDTVLTRTWFKPADLFYRVAERLHGLGLIGADLPGWVARRTQAEVDTRKASATEETTLDAIYAQLAGEQGWDDARRAQARQVEVDCEIESVRPIAAGLERVSAAREGGKAVLFLSDMYLPTGVVRAALDKAGAFKPGDQVLVSSDAGLTKNSGRLYRHVLDDRKLSPGQLEHTGDNLRGDVDVPRGLGINANHFDLAQATRHEQAVYSIRSGSATFRSLLAGVSRAVRLSRRLPNEHLQAIWDTASDLIGPVLFGYVYWVLRQAERMGLDRLYFLARDGQIMLKIAGAIGSAWGCGVQCRYLYASRQALHLPAIGELNEAEWDWIFASTQVLSVRSVCRRVVLNPQTVAGVLDRGGFPPARWDENLDRVGRQRLLRCFQSAEIAGQIAAIAAAERRLTLGYLGQEGLLAGGKFGLVDIGWNGRLQRSISRLLAAAGRRPPDGTCGFYFGVHRRLTAFDDDRMFSYFVDADTRGRRALLGSYIALYEIFCAADHGNTAGYEQRSDGSFGPVLKEDRNERALAWGLAAQQEAIERFATEFARSCSQTEARPEDFLEASQAALEAFLTQPMPAEARSYGAFQVCEDQTDDGYSDLSPRIGLTALASWLVLHRGSIHHGAWIEGSLVRSALPGTRAWLRLLALRRRLGRIRSRLMPGHRSAQTTPRPERN